MKSNLGVPCFHYSPAPPPPIAAVQKAAAAANSTAPLQIRAPSELLLGLPANLRTTQWRHPAQTLLKEHIKYEVQVGRSTPKMGEPHANYMYIFIPIPAVPRLNGCERTTWHRVHKKVHTEAESLRGSGK